MILQITIFLIILLLIFLINKRGAREGFQAQGKGRGPGFTIKKMALFPTFATSKGIYDGVFSKIQAAKGEEGLTILPRNAAEVNQILGLPPREELTDKNFQERKEEQEEKEKEEVIDVLEYVPFLWHCQDILFQEYRKYFTEVECLKYYHNVFKTSRETKKPKVMKWHKENCDISLDLNANVEKGKKTYIGMDAIRAKMQMSDLGR